MQKLIIKSTGCQTFTKPSQVIYIKAEGSYSTIFLLNDKKITISKNIGSLEKLLKSHGFYRVHQSFLVNVYYIEEVRSQGKKTFVHIINSNKIEVSRRRKKDLISFLNNTYLLV